METNIFTEIINVIDSKSLKAHLLANQEILYFSDYLNIITRAPISLERKHELLVGLKENTENESDIGEVAGCLAMLDDAVDRLVHFSPGKEVLIVIGMNCDTEDGEERDCCGPVASYMEAQRIIQKTCQGVQECYWLTLERPDWVIGVDEPKPTWYWRLELYRYKENGTLQRDYTYYCSWNGEVQYFLTEPTTELEQPFSWFQDLNLPVPYRPGDFLYVDRRPYSMPMYCLITYVTNDCRGVDCLFRARDGQLSNVTFKNGYCDRWPFTLGSRISPFYSAEILEGVLPEECDSMRELSAWVYNDPTYGRRFSELWNELCQRITGIRIRSICK